MEVCDIPRANSKIDIVTPSRDGLVTEREQNHWNLLTVGYSRCVRKDRDESRRAGLHGCLPRLRAHIGVRIDSM